jgi:hypothetical protein
MRQAKAFLVVCAGIFLLALSYHLGARSAGAQVGTDVECVADEGANGCAVIDHRLYRSVAGTPSVLVVSGEIPNPARAVACGAAGVVLEDGTVYQLTFEGVWRQLASLPFSGAPTPTKSISIGQLKAKYAK